MMNINILIHFELMKTGDEHFEVVLGVLVVENQLEMKIKILLLAPSQISINRINGNGFGGA